MKILDNQVGVKQDADGLYRTLSQEIPDSYISALKNQKDAGGYTDTGEMLKMASIPVVIAEQMLKEGVDVYKAPIRDIVKWLKNNDMGHFLTTDKRI